MQIRLYIGNISRDTTEQDLCTMFSEAGTVESVDIIMDRLTGKQKCFAFVTMSNQVGAEKAISMFNSKEVNARTMMVNIAQPREERSGVHGNRAIH